MFDFFNGVNDFLYTKILIAVLIGLGLLFSIATRFVQFVNIKEMFRVLFDKATLNAEGKKGISSFMAFTISTASRVGTGNMAGVATAIAAGGPGAVFWMWIIALVGGATSFIESTLAQIYKVKDGKDGFRGGPAYYMEQGLKKRWMGVLFALIITFCFGLVFNSVQSNTIAMAFESSFGISRLTVGIIIAAVTAVIIFGGVKRIGSVTQVLVPAMATLYVLLALYILIQNIGQLPDMFVLIFENAFGLRQVAGGGLGAALLMGIKRGLFSNEAGMGSAPNAAATAAVTHPVKQGLIQTLGVFTDTLLICSATAFMIILSGRFLDPDIEGIQLTQAALSAHVGDWSAIFVAIAILLFAFSSVIGNYYYGETNIEFIGKSRTALLLYRVAVLAMVIIGALAPLGLVWLLADVFMGIMALINLIALAMLYKVAIACLKDYRRQRKAGKDPVFYADTIPGLENVEWWQRSEADKADKLEKHG